MLNLLYGVLCHAIMLVDMTFWARHFATAHSDVQKSQQGGIVVYPPPLPTTTLPTHHHHHLTYHYYRDARVVLELLSTPSTSMAFTSAEAHHLPRVPAACARAMPSALPGSTRESGRGMRTSTRAGSMAPSRPRHSAHL